MTYTWNARDQLVSLSGPGVTTSFQYDAVGRRKSKTVNGTTTNFLYDGLNVVQELNDATPTANLLTSLGIDETLQRIDSAGPRSFLTDGLGSTLALTDSAGLVLIPEQKRFHQLCDLVARTFASHGITTRDLMMTLPETRERVVMPSFGAEYAKPSRKRTSR